MISPAPASEIFDFTFNYFSLLSLLGTSVNLILIYLVLSRGVQSSANKWFTLFLSLLALWGVGEFFGRLSGNPAASSFWSSVSSPGFVFMSPIFFLFTLTYIGKDNFMEGFGRRLLVFGSGLLMLFLIWNTNLIVDHSLIDVIKLPWGWSGPTAAYFTFFVIWLEVFFVVSLYLLIKYFLKLKNPLKKKQTQLMIIALLIPLVIGTLTDALFPIIKVNFPGTAVLFTSVMGVITTYAILRYKLFAINPAVHFANIVKTMNEALIVCDSSNSIQFTNDAVLRLFGFNPESLQGRKIQTLLQKSEEQNIFETGFLAKINNKELVTDLEINLSSSTGEEIPVNLSGSPLFDETNSLTGYVIVASDIREIRKLVYNLVAERNKLSVTLSGITEGVFVVDKSGVISFFNEAAEKIFETKASAVIGKKADDVLHITDQEGPVKVEYFFPQEKLSKDMVTYSRNGVKIQTAAGIINYANLIAANIVEGESINLGAIVTLHDVSQEKELEEMKLDFVSMAAHELRTPLTSIRGYLSVLQEEIGKKLSEDQYSFLEKAFISSTQLAALVENLLSVSRIERGSLQIQSQVTQWENILEEAYNNFLPQAKERQVSLTYVKPTKKLPFVSVDKFRIGEVVSNLISNALNYTPSGGAVEVSTETSGQEVITHVKDTGPGIPPSALPKLFTKFFRVSGVLEQGSKGTGLGLYISKAIVDMHKGRIWVESEIGKGSIFNFTVPVSNDQNLPAKPYMQKGQRMFLRKSDVPSSPEKTS